MNRCISLKGSASFAYVFRQGKSIRGKYFRINYLKREGSLSRLGLVVTKKAGKAAVRNRIRRRFRHIMAGIIPQLQCVFDIVVYVDKEIDRIPFRELQWQTRMMLKRLGLSD